MKRNIICGIDIGNAAVKTIIAEVDRQSLRPQVVGVGVAESRGIRKGTVADMTETITNIADSVREAETMAGIKVRGAYVSLNGLHIHTQTSRGVIAVSRPDNQITQADVERAVDAASLINLPANREIIHINPINFVIDNQERVKNPVGMRGVRLEVETFIIDGLSTYIHNIAKCINANDIEVLDFVYSPMATALSSLDKQQKEYGVLNVDFGGDTSTLSLFHEGELIYTKVLPVGARHITHDLGIALRIPPNTAERVKLEHASLEPINGTKRDILDLSQIVNEPEFSASRKDLTKIVAARVGEMLDMTSGEIKNTPRHLLPGGVVLIGGGSNLKGLVGFTKDKLKLPVRVSSLYPFDGMVIDQLTDPSFAVAAGLVLWGFEKEYNGGNRSMRIGKHSFNSPGFKKAFSWLKNFLP